MIKMHMVPSYAIRDMHHVKTYITTNVAIL
jgi:hypothetical protein